MFYNDELFTDECEQLYNLKLKTCPHCGAFAVLTHEHYCTDTQFDDDHDTFYVKCQKCGAQGHTVHIKNARYRSATCDQELKDGTINAIESWNKRYKRKVK